MVGRVCSSRVLTLCGDITLIVLRKIQCFVNQIFHCRNVIFIYRKERKLIDRDSQ